MLESVNAYCLIAAVHKYGLRSCLVQQSIAVDNLLVYVSAIFSRYTYMTDMPLVCIGKHRYVLCIYIVYES